MSEDLLTPPPTDAARAAPKSPAQRAERHAGVVGAARGGLGNLAGAFVAGAAGFGVTWLVARGLGPASAGSFFAATSAFVLFSSVARLGTSTALVYWPARLRAQGRPELIAACLRIGLVPVAILATVLGVTLWFGAPHWFPRFEAPLRTLALLLPVAALAESLLAATRGYRMMRPTVLLDKIVKPAGQLLGVAILAAFALAAGVHVPATGWAVAWVLPYIPVFVFSAILLWRKVEVPSEPVAEENLGRAFWRFTAPRALASCAQTALQRVDVLMVASLAGLVPAAAYAVAGRFIVVGQLANGAISQAVQPRLAEMLSVDDRAGANRLYQLATAWLVLVSWPLHLMVLDYADFYLSVFGPSYVSAVPAVRVLAVAMLIATGCGMVDIVLSMAGRTTWNLMNVLIALTTMVAIDLYLIPRLGALGAAIGLAAAVTVNNLLPLAQLGWSMRLHPFGPATRTAMLLAMLSFGVVPWLTRQIGFGLLAGPICGLVVYATGLRLFSGRLELAVILAARRLRAR
ncbi:MAG TPA: multi antimicrobial extrusion protein MatE [Micromonosporaceae bacterium]|nr:multi antimicrobial extrusion protein MatE [Micromonosporaceae bacterium]HCU51538.1 multi antimicrobial extrusion protein MatE [Micromonosporaceae bacterium]